MNGLEAIELMKQGKMVTSEYEATTYIFKIIDGNVCSKRIDEPRFLYQTDIAFNFSCDYQEYIEPKPLTGWERVEEGERYRTIDECSVLEYREDNDDPDVLLYNIANYFSTKEKAEEINFKKTLFRKLQRFSDENGGNEIDWNDPNQKKWSIKFDRKIKDLYIGASNCIQNFGQVHFISEKVARNAIELFHDDLIKYFTHDWSGKDETPINLNSEER